MLVDLQKVPAEGQALDVVVSPSILTLDIPELELIRDVAVEGSLTRVDGDAYRLRGRVSTEVRLSCVRCLESFEMRIDEALDLTYLPASRNVAPEGEEDRGLDEEELAVGFYRDDEIDITHMVMEQIVLALPMKPVCRETCQGLCPECGSNRNVEPCACIRDEVDPRWESLKSLL